MKILITGVCGFVGSTVAEALLDADPALEICGVDNFIRPGSEGNRRKLQHRGVTLFHGDVRSVSDFESLPPCDWVLDAAANPTVLAGVDGRTSSRQVVEHNLVGTINILEYCKKYRAGFILLSTSRVYSIAALAGVPVEPAGNAFKLRDDAPLPPGLSPRGVTEAFSTTPPLSLYGSTKLASELLAIEYGESFGFLVRINRCSVLGGAGQFGRIDQGIFSFWINSWAERKPLKYIGFGGLGRQVRDLFHPRDLAPLLRNQMSDRCGDVPFVCNLGGGMEQSMSLAALSGWCGERLGPHTVGADTEERKFDLPWFVMDTSLAAEVWGWAPVTPLGDILEEIARHAENNPGWLDLTGG